MSLSQKIFKTKLRRWLWGLAAVYLLLLLASHVVRWMYPGGIIASDENVVKVSAVRNNRRLPKTINLAYQTFASEQNNSRPVIVLLHGSPGESDDFSSLAPELKEQYRIIAPDLPGFGNSTHAIPDYSFRAHAHYVLELLDKLKIQRAHFVGYSMGGGVALSVADIAPQRVASLTMLSAIGVQEMELLDEYHINHTLHGLQLFGMWVLRELTPHFGYFDGTLLGVSYARNFYDSDQRPLRGTLQHYAAPMLILHGQTDVMVPVEAALEHYRLVPQSELQLFDANHFMVYTDGETLAPFISDFVSRVEQGTAITKANADPVRVAQALKKFNPANLPRLVGVTALAMLLLIVAATLVSEDLTTISVGVMVAQAKIGFLFGAFSCFLGIFVGDVLLYLAGRVLGRPALRHIPLKWFLSPESVEKSSAWFSRQGSKVIFISRFLPGARLPTYFAAGMLNTSFWWFTFYFALACLVWTPLLIGLSAFLGGEVVKREYFEQQHFLVTALLAGIVLWLLIKLLLRLATWRGRRMLVGKWRRLTHWEFWPPYIFYPPVICYIAWLAVKNRSLTLFTAANPAIPCSGFIGESKAQILGGLGNAEGSVARYALIPAADNPANRITQAKNFLLEQQISFPIVLKPDAGQRGWGVQVIRSENEIAQYLQGFRHDVIIQEYIAGAEFGVFYYRYPNAEKGEIFSITEKKFPVITGDGRHSVEHLILDDERAVCLAKFYTNKQGENASTVLPDGEQLQLVEVGSHCRGAIFLDGNRYKTEALENTIDRISQSYEGFYFGRFDIRAPSVDAFEHGKDFKIIELNGVTSEATHIYDPKNSLLMAYGVLFKQWRIAFEIGRQNLLRGKSETSLREIIRELIRFKKYAAQ